MYHKTGQNTTRVRRAGMEMKEKSGHVWIYAARVRRAGEQQRTWMQLKESFLVVVIRHVKFPHSPPSDGILMWYWENWDNGNVQSSVCKHAEQETWWDANSELWPGWSCTSRHQEVPWQSSGTFTQLKAFLESCTPACAEETGDSGGHRHGRPTSAGPSRPRTCGDLPRGLLCLLSLLFPTSDCISRLIKAAQNLTTPVPVSASYTIFSTWGSRSDLFQVWHRTPKISLLHNKPFFLSSTALFIACRFNPLKSNILIEGLESLRVWW